MRATFQQDLRFALRQFRRNPGFTVAAVITLALGVGMTTAIFSLVNGIILRQLPFPDADQLIAISTLEFPDGVSATNTDAANHIDSSYPNFFDWREQNHTFQSLASSSYSQKLFSRMNGEGARVIAGARVSANLFETLGVAPALGRSFMPEEERPGHRVVVLSYELWVSDFASSPNVIGQDVLISDEPSTVVGVMPKGFHFPVDTPAYFWATFAADADGVVPTTSRRGWQRLSVIGRLKPGVRVDQGLADLNTIQARLAGSYTENRHRPAVSFAPLLDKSVSGVRSGLTFLLAAAFILLLIGCTNVAGLLLVRANARRSEFALRSALGASGRRVLRQLLLEAMLLALIGGTFGIIFAIGLLRIALHFIPSSFPRLYDVSVDGRVLAFAILLSALTALIFGLLPAWRMMRQDPAHALREGAISATGSSRRNRLHQSLIVVETALSFTLLVGSGLLIRTVVNVLKLEPGFDHERTVFFDIALTQKRYPDPGKVPYFEKIIPQFAAIPGVTRVSAAHPLPVYWPPSSWANINISGYPKDPDKTQGAISAVALPGYFETLSIPLLHGRTFTAHDNDAKSAPVAVINQSFARKYFPAENPVGRYFIPEVGPPEQSKIPREIVGVVGDTRTGDMWNPYQPEFFLPYAQEPTHQRPLVVMRVVGDRASYENAARKIVAAADPDAPFFGYHPLDEVIEKQAIESRFEAWVLSVFACVALLLSAVGLYAVLSYVVAQRTRELGLRMALGASRGNLLQSVLSRGLRLAFLGIGAGGLVSICASRLIRELLFKVAPLDPLVFAVVTLALVFVSVVSALVPALRAAWIEPMRCLRTE